MLLVKIPNQRLKTTKKVFRNISLKKNQILKKLFRFQNSIKNNIN